MNSLKVSCEKNVDRMFETVIEWIQEVNRKSVCVKMKGDCLDG